MRCTMATGKCTCLLLLHLALTAAFSVPHATQSKGRKLFGGYRIVPKVCQPSMPTRMRSDEPAICMFNYECSRRNGEVVGACMDGFLFGACCQLPSKTNTNGPADRLPSVGSLLHRPIDHVPDIPILLNPDGTPQGMTISQTGATSKPASDMSNHLHEGTTYTRVPTFRPSTTPSSSHTNDVKQNAEKTQLPPQPDLSTIMQDFPALLGQHNVLDELNLPGLLTHSGSNNDIQDHQDSSAVNPVTTLLSPDQILQIADPVDQLPALFSHGLSQHNHSSADTILLNENGTVLDESHNPDELFKPSTESSLGSSTQTKRVTHQATTVEDRTKVSQSVTFTHSQKPQSTTVNHGSSPQWIKFSEQTQSTAPPQKSTTQSHKVTSSMTKLPVVTQMYTNSQRHTSLAQATNSNPNRLTSPGSKPTVRLNVTAPIEVTTPMTTSVTKGDLVRVPTITYDAHSGNKKDDVIDKEEIAINHIISILNGTTPGASDTSVTVQGLNSPIHTWINVDSTSKQPLIKISTSKSPSSTTTHPYTYYKPAVPSTYYNYETVATETNYPSYSTSNFYSSSVSPSTKVTYDGSTNNFGYSSRPTTHPPAPTVIVLGPLGTDYTTETTQKTATKRPTFSSTKPVQRPSQSTTRPTPAPVRTSSVSTKKPNVSTTITHNISTVISNVASNNVVSTSFISVNLKDGTTSTRPSTTSTSGFSTEAVVAETTEERVTTRKPIWTTISSWSDKPSFHLKPSTPAFNWENNMTPVNTLYFKDPNLSTTPKTTSSLNCEEETAAPDDLINFPPVRNPNLNTSQPISQQEKPTIVETVNNTGYPDIELLSENDIPTPTFIEDDVLTNKVDAFVNKIVESLQGNFQELKDIVYNKNATSPAPTTVTRRPPLPGTSAGSTTRKPVRRPSTSKPTQVTTRRPVTTKRPGGRPTSQKPSASSERPARPSKPTTSRPTRPAVTTASVTTKRPQVTTKRTRPTRRPTTTPVVTEAVVEEEAANSVETTEVTSTVAVETSSTQPNFRTQCGVRPLVKSGRIVGGKGAKFGEWPWQVLVRETTWLGLFTKNKCGGVLITDKYVITAAHCQPGFLASLVAVFGEHDISGELEPRRSITRNVRRVTVNRGYDPATFENDLALLELESPVQFDAHVVPICMPDDGADFTGRMATVTGWGRLKYNGGVPSILQEVQVPIMENSVCQEMFQTAGHSKLILDSFLCAGYANGQKDSCEGDSGGPLVMERPDGRWILVGTVSHGIKCAAPYLPGVYMRTTYFKPWLHSITGV